MLVRMRMSAPSFYRFYTFITWAAFRCAFTVTMVFYVKELGFSPMQLVLTGTALELSIFLFEIPTGIVADLYGRRISVIIGTFVIGAGFVLTALSRTFAAVAFAQALWGFGYTFTSGALSAWLSDETGAEKAAPLFVSGMQLSNAGSMVGIAAAVLLGTGKLSTPILAAGVIMLALGFLALPLMRETGFAPVRKAGISAMTGYRQFFDVFRDGARLVRRVPGLVAALAAGLFFGLYSEGFDRLWTASFLHRFTLPQSNFFPFIAWFGLIEAVSMVLSIAAGAFVLRLKFAESEKTGLPVLLACTVLLASSLAAFPLVGTLAAALACYWLVWIARHIIDPLYIAWVNRKCESSVRATVLSMSSQMDALGQIAGGPVVGFVAGLWGLVPGMLFSAGLVIPALTLMTGAAFGRKGEQHG